MSDPNTHSQPNPRPQVHNDNQPPVFRRPIIEKCFKVFMVGATLFAVISATIDPGLLPEILVKCLKDTLQEGTSGLNQALIDNPQLMHVLQIISGALIDILLLGQLVRFSVYGKSWRFPIAVVFAYVLSYLFKVLYAMQYPPGYAWQFPGIYSITVPYGKDNNFLFTAHLSLITIIMCDFITSKLFKLAVVAFVALVFQAGLLLILRGSYSIDLYISVFFGHYFWIMAGRIAYLIDFKLLGIPFHKRFPTFSKQCQLCKEKINEWITYSGKNRRDLQLKEDEEYQFYSDRQ